MESHANRAGFKIPEYQRHYNWNMSNIKRLLEDCLNRFYSHSSLKPEDDSSLYTFLGTIILVTEDHEKGPFDGISLIVIDGQQRLTTLSLICCALIEIIKSSENGLDEVCLGREKEWIKEEIDFQLEALFSCVSGRISRANSTTVYPRIIRHNDQRGYTVHETEYLSPISKFICNFTKCYLEKESFASFPGELNSDNEPQLLRNYQYIKKQMALLYSGEGRIDDDDVECEYITYKDFIRVPFRKLFDKLTNHCDDDPQIETHAVQKISTPNIEGLIRTILFVSYFTKHVVLTRVETDSEEYAFDIFDSLNTTGEPLTALEAFKPKVVRFADNNLQGQGRYTGSQIKAYFDSLDRYLGDDADKRQRMTKELLISFALYHDGTKLSLNLSSQRIYLQKRFEKLAHEKKPSFVASINHIAEYYNDFWENKGIKKLDISPESEILQFCFGFVYDLKTKLAIPVLTRYWHESRSNPQIDFSTAVKALTAFLVIRRAATGFTRGIDSDLRSLMKEKPHNGGDPLCLGEAHTNTLLSTKALRAELRNYLAKAPNGGIKDRNTWIDQACSKPLADYSRPLCRFLLFAASHNACPDANNPGFLTREGYRASDKDKYLNYSKWDDIRYSSLEHVAPATSPGAGWNDKIYQQDYIRHTIGNIILLPRIDNSRIGNASWEKKHVFYEALASRDVPRFHKIIDEAITKKIISSQVGRKLKKSQDRLDMLDSIVSVGVWDKEFIDRRTKNILTLVWDIIWPWLED